MPNAENRLNVTAVKQDEAASEDDHSAIEADVGKLRQVQRGRDQARECRDRPPGEEHGCRARDGCQDEALHEKLDDETAAAGAERDPYRHFLTASERTRDEQAGHVGARHEQHQRDRRQKHQQRGLRVADQRLTQRQREVLGSLILRRVFLFHLSREGGQVRARPLERHVGFQPRRRERPVGFSLGRRAERHRHRQDDVRLRVHGKAESARRDANDLPRGRSDLDGPANHRGVAAEARLPRVEPEDGDRSGTVGRVDAPEAATERRGEAQRLEQSDARNQCCGIEGFWLGKDDHAIAAVPRKGFEGPLTRAEVDEISDGDELLGHAGPSIPVFEQHESVRLRIGQRTQEHGVHDREDRHVCPHAERQRQHSDGGEPHLSPEQPKRVTNVEQQHGEHLGWREPPAVQKEQDDSASGHSSTSGVQRLHFEIAQRRFEQIAARQQVEASQRGHVPKRA